MTQCLFPVANVKRVELLSKMCNVGQTINESQWGMLITEKDENKLNLSVEVNIPVDAIIGR